MRACQSYFGGIERSTTLHVGDQFLSAGANDFKVSPTNLFFLRLGKIDRFILTCENSDQARLACTTAWIASPLETVQLLDELTELENDWARKTI